MACHGYGQLAEPFARALEPLSDPSRIVAVPEGLSRFYLDDPAKRHGPDSPVGASWMTREDRTNEIADYVEYLDLLASTLRGEVTGDTRIVALGFSQGVATVARWAVLGRTPIHRLILWGGALPTDLPTDRGADLFGGASLRIVAGRQDRLVPPDMLERDRMSLAERGIQAQLILHDGGHALKSDTLRQLAAEISSAA